MYELIAYILKQCTENENKFNETLTHFINNKITDNLIFESNEKYLEISANFYEMKVL